MSRYIEEHRGRFGVEPICRVLDVSASAYYQRATGERSERVVADERLLSLIEATHAANYFAYGYRKMGLTLKRAGHHAGRDRVKRLMRQYFPKGTDLARHTAAELAAVAATLNARPRKTLGWRTPAEKLTEYLASAA